MNLKRSECYETLFRMKEEKNINVEEQLKLLASSSRVPKSVIKFIEDNSTRTLEDFIGIIARGKHFFTNLCFNYSNDISTYIKALLSMLIHIRITLDKNPELITSVNKVFDINRITKVIKNNLTVGDNDEEVIKLAKELKLVFLDEEINEE